jgi:GDPmannose 4,6-dehydratase
MMWLMLQQEAPEDFVIATGEQHSVREFIEKSAACLGLSLAWEGREIDEVCKVAAFDKSVLRGLLIKQMSGEATATREAFLEDLVRKLMNNPALTPGYVLVRIDPRYFRPTEVESLLGDPSKAKTKLGWRPAVTFAELVREMVEEDFAQARRDSLCLHAGFDVHEVRE